MARQTKTKKSKRDRHDSDAGAKASIDLVAEISRLKSLAPLEYEAVRQVAAKKLGVRVSVLDDLVKQRNTDKATDLVTNPETFGHRPR